MLPFRLQLCLFCVLVICAVPSLTQTSGLFQWDFVNNDLSTSLPTCISLPIVVQSYNPTTNTTQGTPPYYMIAFSVGGTPTTTLIGTDESNLSWTITEPAGSQLVLSVVDANGSAGGVQPRIFTITGQAGQNTQCVTSAVQNPPFTVTANVTGDLQTCQQWGLTAAGGVPPYTATIVQLASSNVTNVTLALGEDSFTYINDANAGGQIIGAFSDATGRWASGTPMINTSDSAQTTCVGFLSSGGTATSVPQTKSPATTSSQHSVAIILSVAFVLLFIGTGIVGVFYLHRRRQCRRQAMLALTTPRQFVEVESQLPSVHAVVVDDTGSWGFPPRGGASSWAAPMPHPGVDQGVASNHSRNPTSQSSTNALSYTSGAGAPDAVPVMPSDRSWSEPEPTPPPFGPFGMRRGFSRFPTSSVRHSVKQLEAGDASAPSPDSEYPLESAISDRSNVLGRRSSVVLGARAGNRQERGMAVGVPIEEEPSDMYQYEDGGPFGELPPPPPYNVQGGVDRAL